MTWLLLHSSTINECIVINDMANQEHVYSEKDRAKYWPLAEPASNNKCKGHCIPKENALFQIED